MERPNYIQDLLSANWTDVMSITESNSSRGIINFFILLFFLLSFFFLAFKKKKKKKRNKWNRNPNYDDDTNFEEGQSASSSQPNQSTYSTRFDTYQRNSTRYDANHRNSDSSEWRDRSPQYQDYDYRGWVFY